MRIDGPSLIFGMTIGMTGALVFMALVFMTTYFAIQNFLICPLL